MKSDNVMKLDFLSKSTNESFARVAVASFVSQLDPTIEELSDIKTAVSEAVTNAIVHGYENEMGLITIHVHIKDKEVTIQVKDRGRGIEDVAKAKEVLSAAGWNDTDGDGIVEKEGQKAEKTIKNEESLDRTGGGS